MLQTHMHTRTHFVFYSAAPHEYVFTGSALEEPHRRIIKAVLSFTDDEPRADDRPVVSFTSCFMLSACEFWMKPSIYLPDPEEAAEDNDSHRFELVPKNTGIRTREA